MNKENETSEENLENLWNDLENARKTHEPLKSAALNEAAELSKLIYRQLFLLNGGALALTSTLLTGKDIVSVEDLFCASKYWLAGLLFVLFSTYATHLNYMQQFIYAHVSEQKAYTRIKNAFFPRLQEEEMEMPKYTDLKINASMWLSHVLGILSAICLFFGAYAILGNQS